MKEKILVVIHLIFILLAYTSPFWLDWRLVGVGALLYWVQLLLFKACVISIAQYGNTETSFVAVNLNKVVKRLFQKELSIKSTKHVLDWLPLFFLTVAFIIQNYLGIRPIVHL